MYGVRARLSNGRVAFPPCCSNCLAPNPTKKFKTEVTFTSAYYTLAGKHRRETTHSAEVPICSSCDARFHPLILKLLFWLSVATFVGMIAVAVVFNVDYHSDPFLLTWAFSFFSALVLWYAKGYFARMRGFPPVRIKGTFIPDEETRRMYPQMHGTADLEFVNEKYMEMFKQANEVEDTWTT
jgi:hypothetical protein